MRFLPFSLIWVMVLNLSCQPSDPSQGSKDPSASQTEEFSQVYLDPSQEIEKRVWDLIRKMTVEEKIAQLNYDAPAIDRLGIPAYNWWNECLHGVARAGQATVFPQAIGMAASFDQELIYRVATAISDEARAKYHAAVEKDNRLRYAGLTFWTPNVNIFRDPRWGRGQETYGEDPFLTSTLGSAFVKGLQGDDPKYLKAAACAKHYVVHSGPEGERHVFDAVASEKDMYETYLPAFRALVDAGVEAVMCAYNRTNGEPCCGSEKLLQDILREEFGFDGHIVSDCWALVDFHDGHKVTPDPVHSAALALKSGVNLNCGDTYPYLNEALDQELVTEAMIDSSLAILYRTRFKLGMFDPDHMNPYADISTDVINCQAHQDLALEAAQKSLVLLKNQNNTLPLSPDIKYLFVTGPNASTTEVLLGNYYGLSPNMKTILEGITEVVNHGSLIQYKQGFLLDRENVNPIDWTTSDAQQADAIIAVIGISGLLEGEEGESIASPTKGDRFGMNLPENQVEFMRRLRQDNDKPIIAVITGGSPMDLSQIHELADAVIFAWYPGEQGGKAVADVIFGNVSPSGRLPITFPRSLDQLPPYADYDMTGRTYRYMEQSPMYPFGFGLSYTQFEYTDLELSKNQINPSENLNLSFTLTNKGQVEADEVVQLYISDQEASFRVPIRSLKGIKRVNLSPGASQQVDLEITPEMLTQINMSGKPMLEPGIFKIWVGGSSPGTRSTELGAGPMLITQIEVLE
ncbi:MAG: glycoside hydrolase family 3 C-terminal domain-containing protein [Candidatus Cyclobacteriaceae bacterium M3_2C_046]